MLAPAWHRRPTPWLSLGVFLSGLVVYGRTMAPTLSFWDCGEFITTAHILGIPHQPGTPLYVLMGRVFDILLSPLLGIARSVNFMSAFFSALAVMFLYLTIQDIARRADPDSGWMPHAGGLVGALFLLFSNTFWNNAIEAEVYGMAAFVIAFVTWLAVKWYDIRGEKHSNRLLYLMVYLLGLGVGFHLGSLLVYPGIFLLIVLARGRHLAIGDLMGVSAGLGLFLLSTMFGGATKVSYDSGVFLLVLTLIAFPGVFPLIQLFHKRQVQQAEQWGLAAGIIIFLLSLMLFGTGFSFHAGTQTATVDLDVLLLRAIAMLLAIGVWRSSTRHHFILIGCGVFLLGLSVHLFMLIRAGLDPAINQSQPDNMSALMSVLRREQYPPIDPAVRKADLWWQIRYYYNFLLDQFTFVHLGKAHLTRLATILVPIFLGLLGAIHGLMRARPWSWMLVVNYFINADILNLYLNFSDHEVRERDYFFFAGFMFFALFIGLGVSALLRYLSGPLWDSPDKPPARHVANGPQVKAVAVVLVLLAAMPALAPGNTKWFEHDRHKNEVPREYAWNLLAGLDPHAIVFTNGDNDTFPLWYMQEVEGFRRDVTVVNLALINLSWYIEQMKHRDPPLNISFSDEEVRRLRPEIRQDPLTHKRRIYYVRDFVVADIIRNCGTRPVFFAVTIPQENMADYFSQLQMEGLAYRYTGHISTDKLPTVDSDRLLANMYGVYDFSATLTGDTEARRSGFRELNGVPQVQGPEGEVTQILGKRTWRFDGLWRFDGHHRRDVYFDRNTENLLGNYPAGLIRAGYDYILGAQKPDVTDEGYAGLVVKAEAAYGLAAAFDPTFPMVTDIYPLVLIERGRSVDAANHMESIRGRIPQRDYESIVPQLLQAMVQAGDDSVAVGWMEGDLAQDPADTFASRQLEMVRRQIEARGETSP